MNRAKHFVYSNDSPKIRNDPSIQESSFELNGQNFTALNGGPMYMFSEAISIAVSCKTQEEEIDHLWALSCQLLFESTYSCANSSNEEGSVMT